MQKQEQKKQIRMTTFSSVGAQLSHLAPQLIGERQCPNCNEMVPIYLQRDKEISICLSCDNKNIQESMEQFRIRTEADRFFKSYSLVPDETRKATFDNFYPNGLDQSQADAQYTLQRYVKKFDNLKETKSFLLQGLYGLGKSHLAHSVAMALKDQYKKVIFVNSKLLLKRIQSTYGSSEISESQILQQINDCDLFILDDIGAEYVKKEANDAESWGIDLMLTIVESRENKANIYTTNYNAKDLAEKYGRHGGRILSRMAHGCRTLKLTGKDRRIAGIL
ncbi:ATP-binding protein [Bacillus pumilus]|uniref:ATP-binding protein n=1 Tax=Bacillus pumilus TaxID=1408 RepID=UPI001E2F1BDE|nr:ATP-binding protein [Bacillus pumilus]MCC9088001.1 ATP-binding protein [Bacillus pumilus]